MTDLKITFPEGIPTCKIEELTPYGNNPRTHSEEQINQLVASMREFGFTNPILIDRETKEIIAGHGRLMAARRLGLREIPIIALSHLTEAKRRKLIIADNQLALNAGWDMDLLATELSALNEMGEDLDVLGFEDAFIDEILNTQLEENQTNEERILTLIDKFGVPPFSILDSKQGYWQNRKREWKQLITENGESREGKLFRETSCFAKIGSVSILDPVLCEILLDWFCLPKKTRCIDPFAGDTSFGVVAALKGYQFTGIEIRQEQVNLNQNRCANLNLQAQYICDDAQNILKHIKEESQDFLFSCPPYYDLEIYSDLEKDASNQKTYEDFIEIINNAFTRAIKTLKENRFAAIVVSNIRNQNNGFYRNFVNDIIKLFQNNGLHFYNDIILANVVGSASQRANNGMKNRKITKIHQNVLVFYKGDPEKIPEIYNNQVYTDNYRPDDAEACKETVSMDELCTLDPVLSEVLLNWFSLGKGTKCIDLYANDAGFGLISALKECEYIGFTENSLSIQENKTKICHLIKNCRFINDTNILKYIDKESQDFLFSYLPQPTTDRDYMKFLEDLRQTLPGAIKSLKDNRFAAIILTNYRQSKTGDCFSLTDEIVKLFAQNDMSFYNDIVFLEKTSEANETITNNMSVRKVVPIHKNVLIFYKGRASQIQQTFKENYIKVIK